MSPLGIQRTIAIIIFLSPWIYIPAVFKDILFIIVGILLFISTLDIRKNKSVSSHEENANKTESSTPVEHQQTHIPSI